MGGNRKPRFRVLVLLVQFRGYLAHAHPARTSLQLPREWAFYDFREDGAALPALVILIRSYLMTWQ